jgi:FkbM family methyltransferase
MKVLHVSFADWGGGAARAAARLHRAERRFGVESRMLVAQRLTDDPDVMVARRWFPGRNALSWQLEQRLLRRARDGSIERALNLVPSGLHRRINASDCDVVHLHWINGGMISIPEIGKIRKPLVWTLHDMWPFAGAEHYAADGDERWRNGYADDTVDGRTWNRKRRRWRHIDPIVIAPSRWLAERSRASALFRQHRVRVIPNPVDPAEFQPRNKADARAALKLPQDRRIILFGAHDAGSARKGVDLLRAALVTLARGDSREDLEVVLFGTPPADTVFAFPTRVLGWVHEQLNLLYNAADVLVAPSRIDNLPNTVAEATASGLPSVAFRVGGLPDLITHRRSGYLAEPFDVEDLAAGITWVLAQERGELSRAVSEQARALMPEPIVAEYVSAYEEAIARPRLRRTTLERLGSDYGGWTVPSEMLRPGDVCYSAGVGEDITFDVELIRRFGCRVFACDPTPRAVAHVRKESPGPPAYNFAPVGLWDADEPMPFYAPANPEHVSHSIVNLQASRESFVAPCQRLSTIMAGNGHAVIDLLKLDVEGAEYRVIDSLLEDRAAVRILCIEFHESRNGRSADHRRERAAALAKLHRAGFRIISAEGPQYTLLYGP